MAKQSDLCCCTAEVLARVLRFNAIEGVQEGAEKPPAGQRIDGAMATLGTDLPLASDLAIVCSLIPVEDRCTTALFCIVQMFLLLLHAGSALRVGTGVRLEAIWMIVQHERSELNLRFRPQ